MIAVSPWSSGICEADTHTQTTHTFVHTTATLAVHYNKENRDSQAIIRSEQFTHKFRFYCDKHQKQIYRRTAHTHHTHEQIRCDSGAINKERKCEPQPRIGLIIMTVSCPTTFWNTLHTTSANNNNDDDDHDNDDGGATTALSSPQRGKCEIKKNKIK